LSLASQSGSHLLTASLCANVFRALVKQMMEKINRVRSVAGAQFFSLLHSDSPVIPHVPHRGELEVIFPRYCVRSD
jgi:hypothetical protein